MTRIATQKTEIARNPAPGTLLTVKAGEEATATFDFENDTPDVADFYLEVSGLPESDWTQGSGAPSGKMAAAEGQGTLTLRFTPPRLAAPDDYPVRVSLVSMGAPIRMTDVILRVEEGDAPETQAEMTAAAPASAVPLSSHSATASPAPVPSTSKEQTQEGAMSPPPENFPEAPPKISPRAPSAAIQQEEAPIRARQNAPASEAMLEVPAPPAPPKVPDAPISSLPAPEPPPVAAAPPVSPDLPAAPIHAQAKPATVSPAPESRPPETPRPPTPVAAPIAPPVAVSVQLPPPVREKPRKPETPLDAPVIMDIKTPRQKAEEELEAENSVEAPPQEAFVLNPAEGANVALMPGESRLYRFAFRNDSRQDEKYRLNYRERLPEGWYTRVKEQAQIVKGGEEELLFRITAPPDAEPGEYPFSIDIGPDDGILEPRNLSVTVLPTPRVRLKVTRPKVTVGPFARAVDFELEVANAGNADTAFRIAALGPAPPADAEDAAPPRPPIYGTPQWAYLFKQEMATVKRHSGAQKGAAIAIPLQLRRRGIWWFGWKETHRLHVAAAPVTRPDIGGEPGADVELTATRWRLLPMSLLLAGPLAFLLALMMVSRPGNLRVTSASYQSEEGDYWVVKGPDTTGDKASGQDKPTPSHEIEDKRVTLEWDAPVFALVHLTGTSDNQPIAGKFKIGSRSDEELVHVGSERLTTVTYRVASLLGAQQISAKCVLTRNDTPLGVASAAIVEKPKPTERGLEMTLAVPRGGSATLILVNQTKEDNRLNYWVARHLPAQENADSAFYQSHTFPPGVLKPQTDAVFTQRETFDVHVKTELNGQPVPETATDEIVFITTDASRPVLIVHLKIAGAKPEQSEP